jgi:hypothetical protein
MRYLLIGSLSVLLLGCNSIAPSGLKISLNSYKALSVSEFEFVPASEYSSCSVSGNIMYDIKLEPANFTGAVSFANFVLEYAGKWRTKPYNVYLEFAEGKLVGDGIDIGQFTSTDDPEDMKKAVCASKSSSDIKIASLGDTVLVFPAFKAVLPSKK